MGVTNVTTLRFVTIKCDTLRADDPNDIFSKVLRNVTASKASLDGDRALETLGRSTEPSRFLTVVRRQRKNAKTGNKEKERGSFELVGIFLSPPPPLSLSVCVSVFASILMCCVGVFSHMCCRYHVRSISYDIILGFHAFVRVVVIL